jgi:hypothetical protein
LRIRRTMLANVLTRTSITGLIMRAHGPAKSGAAGGAMPTLER